MKIEFFLQETMMISGKELTEIADRAGLKFIKYMETNDFSIPVYENSVSGETAKDCSFTVFGNISHMQKYWFAVSVPDDAEVNVFDDFNFKSDKLWIESEIEPDPEICITAVQKNGKHLISIKTITLELCIEAVKNNGLALEFVPGEFKKPEICELAVENRGHALIYVPEELKTEKLCLKAIHNQASLRIIPEKYRTPGLNLESVIACGANLNYVEDKTEIICMAALSNYGFAIKYIDYPTKAMCLASVKNKGKALRFIENKDIDICTAAVENDGGALIYVPEELRTRDICLKAAKQDPRTLQIIKTFSEQDLKSIIIIHPKAIKYIRHQTENLCLSAIYIDYEAIQFIRKVSIKIIITAIMHNSFAIKFIDSPPESVCLFALRRNPECIKFINNLNEKMCTVALKQDKKLIDFIADPALNEKMRTLFKIKENITV